MSPEALFACLAVAALAWLASFFFSGMETGIYALNRERLRIRVAQGDPGAGRLHAILADPEGLISTILVGNNLALFLISGIAMVLMTRLGVPHPGLWNVAAVAPLLFWSAELLPKELFRRHAELLVYRLTGGLVLARRLASPLVWVMKGISLAFTRLFKGFSREAEAPLSRRRLGYLFMAGVQDGVMSPFQNRVVRNILELGGRRLQDAMVPLSAAVGVDAAAGLPAILERARSERHSRLLVFAGGEVLGAVHVLDALLARGREATAGALARPLPRLPADMPLQQALGAMRQARHPMVLADSDGKAVGLVTIKDLVEEVVGELWNW